MDTRFSCITHTDHFISCYIRFYISHAESSSASSVDDLIDISGNVPPNIRQYEDSVRNHEADFDRGNNKEIAEPGPKDEVIQNTQADQGPAGNDHANDHSAFCNGPEGSENFQR